LYRSISDRTYLLDVDKNTINDGCSKTIVFLINVTGCSLLYLKMLLE